MKYANGIQKCPPTKRNKPKLAIQKNGSIQRIYINPLPLVEISIFLKQKANKAQ